MLNRQHRKVMGAAAVMGALLTFGQAQAHEETATVRWGPIELPGATEPDGDGHGSAGDIGDQVAGLEGFPATIVNNIGPAAGGVVDYKVEKPCEDCYITSVEPNLVYENGEVANHNNGVMLHHVVNVNFSEPDVTCRPSLFSLKEIHNLGAVAGGNQRFFAAGNERTVVDIPEGYGYYVNEGDRWGLLYHLMNMSPEPKTVYFEYTFTYVKAGDDEAHTPTPVRPLWTDVDQCNMSVVETQAGYNDVTWDWRNDRTHDLLVMSGHIHNYGINTAWTNTTSGEMLCNSVAGYAAGSEKAPVGPGTGADAAHPESAAVATSHWLGLDNYMGNIATMSMCNYDGDYPTVERRDKMRLNAQIYRPDESHHDMGIMVAYVEEDFCLTDFWCF